MTLFKKAFEIWKDNFNAEDEPVTQELANKNK